jgi:AraC family transcriptional regulator, chitin signaling transcriptional activator
MSGVMMGYTLTLAPPGFSPGYAFAFYALILLIMIYVALQWMRGSQKRQKEIALLKEQFSLHQLKEKHQQEALLLEQQRLKAECDQLKQQLVTKTMELAKKARDNEEKNRLLLTLKEKCEKAQQNPVLFELKWLEMQRLLDSYLKLEDKTFEIQMDELHQEFFRKLRDQFPDLSSNDLRMCAYLKIGLSSKEIADMLNILPSSFYISRSRLRKKLNLQTHEDLYTFLNAV